MTIKEAINILQPVEGSKEALKKAFCEFARKYHPDVNPVGLEMMKLGNLARELLEKNLGTWTVEEKQDESTLTIDQELADIIVKIKGFIGLEIEVRGVYLWVFGNTYPYKKYLKEYGFKWAPVKKEWFYAANGRKPRSRKEMSVEEQRRRYGSEKINVNAYVFA